MREVRDREGRAGRGWGEGTMSSISSHTGLEMFAAIP